MDRALHWLAFDADPPVGTSRTDFFDARIDPKLRSWINAFAAHFASLPYSYLAVTPLHGLRDKLERCRINEDLEVEITDACPTKWSGLVDLYRTLYDTVHAVVDLETKVFATVVFQDLLDYEVEQCYRLEQADESLDSAQILT